MSCKSLHKHYYTMSLWIWCGVRPAQVVLRQPVSHYPEALFYMWNQFIMWKKTFVFYNDWEDYTECMTLEETGLFLQTILKYQKGEELGDIGPIKYIRPRVKKQLDEDNAKRESEIDKRSKAGIEWNKKRRWEENRKKSQVIASAINSSQVIADNVNDNVNVISWSSGSSNLSNDKLISSFPENWNNEEKKASKDENKPNTGLQKKNPWVDQVIGWIKKYCDEFNIFYSRWKQERFYANHIAQLHGELKAALEKEKKDLEGFIKSVIFLSQELYIKAAYSPQLFYDNYAAILNQRHKIDKAERIRLAEKAKTYGGLTPEQKEERRKENARKIAEIKEKEEAEALKKQKETEERDKKIDEFLSGQPPGEIEKLKAEFESTANITVLRWLDKWYQNPFVKTARQKFLFTKFV